MTEQEPEEHGDEYDQDDGLDWRQLGTFAPRIAPGQSPTRRDLGAGGSLLAEARRAQMMRLASRSQLTRPRVLVSAGVTAVLVGLVLSVVVSAVGGVVSGVLLVLAGATGVVAGVRVQLAETTAEVRLTQRSRTEQRLAAELDTLATSGWVLLHDRILPGGHHRVPHVAVGPAGVFVMTPLPPEPLRIVGHQVDDEDYRQLYAGSLHLGSWLHARRWEVEQLETAIADTLEDTVWSGPTVPVVVQVPTTSWWQLRRPAGTEIPEMPYEWQGVEMRPMSAIVEMLRGLPSPLSRTTVASLATTVEQLCPPAGVADDQDSSTSNKPG